ncbi:type III secretion system protein InvA [Burkholderia cepacia]|uniref:Type III secretion system protein InvA n=1 Tax=Burkholderia cepacia TaxID=292 RepID=A0A0J5YRR6_BURCE|nr:EscV/YscV/HrcV family type III secretion system export apparatus protein [Burkholderia cepacia]KML40103.1 type III secretion system protein InvA [Burkholderia cepacia]
MLKKFSNGFTSRPELLIVALMITIIAMLIIPMPTWVIDFLIGLNIVIAILVFMGSFYIERILDFSTFPSILLITTLFRLALSISTSRLILLNADAGHIIATFGRFVIGDSLVVGFVVFSIVTIVQFIVITKGSERVAEVAARFSLDGMPGKQMSIDSDLKAGIIDAEQARERRSVLERESQLYGSFDGAMKFIKGDAIAGIIIALVNLVGGISVGVLQQGMDMSQALNTYTMLTIGDGLVAQVPSLLISIGAGFIVTRVNGSDTNMGRNIMSQLLGKPFVLLVAALLALSIGMLPGFPLPVFALIASSLGGLYGLRMWREKRAKVPAAGETALTSFDESESPELPDMEALPAEAVPFILLLSQARAASLDAAALMQRFRSRFFLDYGVTIPDFVVRHSPGVDEHGVVLMINEIRAAQMEIHFERVRIVNPADTLAGLQLSLERTADGSVWALIQDQTTLQKMGMQTRSAEEELYRVMAGVMTRHITEFFGVQETKNTLDKLEAKYPDLLKETYRHATVQRISEVIQRLLGERISIRNMKLVLEALAQWAPREKDVLSLVEHVRGNLARYISHKFAIGGELRALVVSAETEEAVRQGIRETSAGVFLNLAPAEAATVTDAFAAALQTTTLAQRDMVVLTSVDVRRFIKKLLENQFEELEVISFAEVSDGVAINVIKTI